MKNNILRTLFSVLFLCGPLCQAQEYLSNFSVVNQEVTKVLGTRSDTDLTLPFFEDFRTGIMPSPEKWLIGRNVCQNAGFPYFSPDYKAATFDVLNEYGEVYRHGSSTPFIADSLMSLRINLAGLTPADSVYFSFYYQPQGTGDAPEPTDSLVLKFGCGVQKFKIDSTWVTLNNSMMAFIEKDSIHVGDTIYNFEFEGLGCNDSLYFISNFSYFPDSLGNYRDTIIAIPCNIIPYDEIEWHHVWSSPGMALDTFKLICPEGQWFKPVMIPLDDEYFFTDKFYFLFYNYGSLPTTTYPNDRSNVDEWNIDLIYFDKNRSFNDTSLPVVSFVQQAPSLLKRYRSMPYNQFKNNPTAAMASEVKLYVNNIDSIEHYLKYSCFINQIGTDWTYSRDGNSRFFHGIDTITNIYMNLLFNYNWDADSATFIVNHYLNVIEENSNVKSDTLRFRQGFYNYYSYDDGTPERGYGVTPDEAYFAVQFNASMPDTLRGVQLLFNHTFGDANYDFFDVVVFGDNNGKPGNEIYRLKDQRPVWDDELIYKFAYYEFDEVVKVNSTFYVGIMQQEKESINIGFDTSLDNSQYNFYDSGEGWKNSAFPGSIMLRPVLGKSYFIGLAENQADGNSLKIYPNPAKDVLHIEGYAASELSEIVITDVTGRAVARYFHQNELNISDLNNGLYIIKILTEDGKCLTGKCLVYE